MLHHLFIQFLFLLLIPVDLAFSDLSPEYVSMTSAAHSAVIQAEDMTISSGCEHTCFPALNFVMPSEVPESLDNWWCPMACEHAFLGFSYEVTPCQSLSQLKKEFADMRTNFNSRYFGFDGGDEWETRRDILFETLHSNFKAPFVTRVVQFGSEPLFDNVLSHQDLAEQVLFARAILAGIGILVTVSELAYGYQERGGAQDVLDAIDVISVHMLPFFSTKATTGDKAWPLVQEDMDWFIEHGKGKKLYFDENGWPSVTSPSVQNNTPSAVASISSEQARASAYFQMLDSRCEDLKNAPYGGVGWFAHIYSDSQEVGYGIYGVNGKLKFQFSPRTSC
ncbi:hypothetical protein ID866_5292 [Astraeus odoratus]|nr:hypothetical protein ID866_5292 [Astraeus odoratus]